MQQSQIILGVLVTFREYLQVIEELLVYISHNILNIGPCSTYPTKIYVQTKNQALTYNFV